MQEAIIGAVAALIGATVGFGAAWYSAKAERRLEHTRWERSREDAVYRDIRLGIADVVTLLSELAHSIMWFTFSTLNSIETGRSDDHLERLVNILTNEVHSLISKIVGGQYRLAPLDLRKYEKVTHS